MNNVSVILLHGLCSTPDELLTIDSALAAAGCTVCPLRIAGYSFDAAVEQQRAAPYRSWLQAVSDLAQAQRRMGQHVVLIGISAGASLALGALELCGDVLQGVVLLSTTLRYDGWSIPWYHFLMPLALYTPIGRFWQYRERPPYGVKNPRIRRWIERELDRRRVSCAGAAVIGVGHLREHDRLRRHILRSLPNLPCPPVLALQAVEDEVASPENVRMLQRALKAPSLRAVLLPDSHHMISIDNDREQVIAEILAFLRALAGTDGAPPVSSQRP